MLMAIGTGACDKGDSSSIGTPCEAALPGVQRRVGFALSLCQNGLLHSRITDGRGGCRRRGRRQRRRSPWSRWSRHCKTAVATLYLIIVTFLGRITRQIRHQRRTCGWDTCGSHHPGRQHSAAASASHGGEVIECPGRKVEVEPEGRAYKGLQACDAAY